MRMYLIAQIFMQLQALPLLSAQETTGAQTTIKRLRFSAVARVLHHLRLMRIWKKQSPSLFQRTYTVVMALLDLAAAVEELTTIRASGCWPALLSSTI